MNNRMIVYILSQSPRRSQRILCFCPTGRCRSGNPSAVPAEKAVSSTGERELLEATTEFPLPRREGKKGRGKRRHEHQTCQLGKELEKEPD